jgi:cytochrome c5
MWLGTLAFGLSMVASIIRWKPILAMLLLALGRMATAQQQPAPALVWDATFKETFARSGDTNVLVAFTFTNTATTNFTIEKVTTSCGCSLAVLPQQPWRLEPGTTGDIAVRTDLRGKRGVLVKSAILYTSGGIKVLTFRINIQEPLIEAERQAVFKGDCARCHVEPTRGKTGKELFAAACGICHETEHRASMVPDLRMLKTPGTADYWRSKIAMGKPNSLMPAFAAKEGGPLTEDQIQSLVGFLTTKGTLTPTGDK